MIRIKAHYDGQHLCPYELVELPRDVPLTVLLSEREIADSPEGVAEDLFSELEREAGLIDGPSDWAAEHDHHLFRAPRTDDAE